MSPSGADSTSAARPLEGELTRGSAVGRYTILTLVGSGAMGRVFAAYDPLLDRKVALKLLQAGGGPDADRARAQLLREAKVLAKLSHRAIVAVHDAGLFGAHVFVAAEFVEGVTLNDWLAARARTRAEILAVFTSAARGLAAAHAVGVVHRDFKPGNVMITRDGSVRVMDFGHLGTPLFMAPEQLAGRTIDARADQFSFCAALHRALTGAAPFGGDTVETITAGALAGRVEPPPPKSNLPVWLRRVVARGLSVDPDARWPSMDELVAALQRDPTRTRRWWSLAAGVLALVGLSTLTLARGAGPLVPLCLGGPSRLADVWESTAPPHPRRDAVDKGFLASGAPDAHDVGERVAVLLDRYRAGWLASYRDACEATHVRLEQTPALLDLRMACLGERRLALSALTDVLVTADRDVVRSAVDAANALPPLDRCADRKQLETSVEPPRDDATRVRVEELRARAAIAKALSDTGKHEEARRMASTQLAEARAIGYQPLVAELLVAFGRTFMTGTHPSELPIVEEEAMWTALAVGRDDLAAEASIGLLAAVGGFLARFDEARALAALATTLLERAGDGHDLLRAWLFVNEGLVESKQHHSQRALELVERAVALKERILPPDHPDLATSLNDEAEVLAQLDRAADALRLNARAYDIFVRALGAASEEAAFTLNNRGEYLIALGRPAEALETLRRALAVWEPQVGQSHPYLGYPLTGIGRATLALARPKDAVAPLERALRLRETGEADATLLAETRFALARALWDAGADHARSVALARQARDVYAPAGDVKDTAAVDGWLATRADGSRRPR